MISFNDFAKTFLLESFDGLHPEIAHLLKNGSHPSKITSTMKSIEKRGEHTGFEKQSKGSSRVFVPHKHDSKINLDGRETHVPVGTKLSIHSPLDKHTGSDERLGQMQNRAEVDGSHAGHGIFNRHHDSSNFKSNPHGVVASVTDHDKENHHHVTMLKLNKFNAKDLADSTKNDDHPKGLSLKKIHGALTHEHDLSKGRSNMHANASSYWHKDHADIEKTKEHPYVDDLIRHMHDTGTHPGDFSPRNLGVHTHPHTGEKRVLYTDHGATNDVIKTYGKARQAMHRANRGW
jgi:hypothetical protein